MTMRWLRLMAVTCGFVVLAPLVGIATPDASAQEGESYFVLYGEPGEYITQGADIFHAESDDVEFMPSVNYDTGVSVMIDVTDQGTFVERWQLDFAAPGDALLQAGDAFTATRFPFQEPQNAGISISGDGRGCNQVAGEFLVREVEYGTGLGHDFETLAIDFRQACDGNPAIVGGIRINSTLDNPDRNFSISPAPTGETHFVVYEAPGSYLAPDGDVFVTPASGLNFVAQADIGEVEAVDLRDNEITVQANEYDESYGVWLPEYVATFAAPNDAVLVAGDEFTDTVDITHVFGGPWPDITLPALTVTVRGARCSGNGGEFRIHEVSVDSTGQVENFAADFRQFCGDVPVVGGVRFNSDVPMTDPAFALEPPAPVDETPPVAEAGLTQQGRIKGTSSNFDVVASCTDETAGVEMTSVEINGIAVEDGQRVKLVLSNRERVTLKRGKLTIQSASITLAVSCIDAAGNTSTATVQPSYEG